MHRHFKGSERSGRPVLILKYFPNLLDNKLSFQITSVDKFWTSIPCSTALGDAELNAVSPQPRHTHGGPQEERASSGKDHEVLELSEEVVTRSWEPKTYLSNMPQGQSLGHLPY